MREGVRRGGYTIITDNAFLGELPIGLRYRDRIRIFPFQTTLGTPTDLGNQHFQ